MRVLHIEDNEDDAFFIGRALKRVVGLELHQVLSGEEGLAYLQGDSIYQDREIYPLPDVILTDIEMLGITGFNVLAWLNNQAEFGRIRRAVLSESDDQADEKLATALGADAYFVKGSDYKPVCDWVEARSK